MNFRPITLLIAASLAATVFVGGSVLQAQNQTDAAKTSAKKVTFPIQKTDAQWHRLLTARQYEVLRGKGTERAFTGQYWNNHDKGTYRCAACGNELFSSDTKFESGTGWPSFWTPIRKDAVVVQKDADGERDEVLCSQCGGHLGHVFDDGPRPTGLRYCMNSISMKFVKKP